MMRLSAAVAALSLARATEVFVMLPLDTVKHDGTINNEAQLGEQLDSLKNANVDGFMADCWWGVTEQSEKNYNFAPYQKLVDMAKKRGMKVQFVASFHQCGGNVGDTCDIPVPPFVHNADGIWYKDQQGNEDREYVSLFADNVKVGSRTPVEMYGNWFEAFANAFSADFGSTIVDIQVGLGPAGELRYPAYQLAHWSFCGIGAFQVWDDNARASFRQAAADAGHSEWDSPPTDAGSYNSRVESAPFFQSSGYQSEYGKFFLNWYFQSLKDHGAAVLTAARKNLGDKVGIAGKISGIHWWYKSSHHAAELTAGYYNANNRDAYAELAEVFKANGDASIDFTCLEMKDSEQSADCASGPQELVNQVLSAAAAKGVKFGGENALPRYDSTAFNQIASYKSRLHAFTYLRLGPDLLSSNNFNNFKNFVNNMHSGASANVTITV